MSHTCWQWLLCGLASKAHSTGFRDVQMILALACTHRRRKSKFLEATSKNHKYA